MSLKGRLSRRKSDNQTQDLATGTSSIVLPLTDTAGRSENEDTPMDDNDTSITPLTREDRQEEIRHSPSRTNKLKIEKAGEHHAERSRSLPRQVPCKGGKS